MFYSENEQCHGLALNTTKHGIHKSSLNKTGTTSISTFDAFL